MNTTELTSKMTFFYKKILPALWFGFLLIFMLNAMNQQDKTDLALKFVIVVALGAASYFLLFKTFFAFADEVHDKGNSLTVVHDNKEMRIALTDIHHIVYDHDGNPPKVSIFLKEAGDNKPISFMPTTELGPFKKNERITDLINRIERLQ